MEKQDFRTCLICGIVSICMLFGLIGTAFVASDKMVENAVMQLQETQQQALDAYRMAVDKYNGVGHTGEPDDAIQLQNPTVPNETEPVVTDPVGTEPVSDNTGDDESSAGDDNKDDDKDTTIGDTVDLVVVPGIDPKPENTGWEDGSIFVDHLIMPGETLSEIAEIYGVSVDEIAEFNGIEDVNRIKSGQILIIPVVEDWHLA